MKRGARFTQQDLVLAVAQARSFAETARLLGLATSSGSTCSFLQKEIAAYNISTDHFTGQGWSRDKTVSERWHPLQDLLIVGVKVSRSALKLRLVREKVKKEECEVCGLNEWRGSEIPLELHHKNGDGLDNRLENLQFLCPNCHAQTDTYRGKNVRGKNVHRLTPNYCMDCHVSISCTAKRCVKCANKCHVPKVGMLDYISDAEFLQLARGRSKKSLARELGVSYTTVAKRFRKLAPVPQRQRASA